MSTPDRKAFFKSILGTLNHIVVTDTLWLKRFATHPSRHAALDPVRALKSPTALDQILFKDLHSLAAHRKMQAGLDVGVTDLLALIPTAQ